MQRGTPRNVKNYTTSAALHGSAPAHNETNVTCMGTLFASAWSKNASPKEVHKKRPRPLVSNAFGRFVALTDAEVMPMLRRALSVADQTRRVKRQPKATPKTDKRKAPHTGKQSTGAPNRKNTTFRNRTDAHRLSENKAREHQRCNNKNGGVPKTKNWKI